MHSIVLLTAMTATSGLFGGHRQARTAQCSGGSCARPVAVARYAPAPSCRTGQCPPATYAPVAQPQAAPAVSYNSYYYPAAAAAPTCTTGTCPRR